jgi:hypothetical protein
MPSGTKIKFFRHKSIFWNQLLVQLRSQETESGFASSCASLPSAYLSHLLFILHIRLSFIDFSETFLASKSKGGEKFGLTNHI